MEISVKNEIFTREICVCAHLTQTRDAQRACAEMEISVKTGGLEVGTGNDTIVEENEKAGMADGCFLCSVCAGADLF